jgi:hypothetical protein
VRGGDEGDAPEAAWRARARKRAHVCCSPPYARPSQFQCRALSAPAVVVFPLCPALRGM